ncbi:hypothetical protein DFJ73DRAFT_768768 [Zopfochytrium polystomum]|nr:hypothetical protein DFJ73DRAFT_768768 [Zopfochytrium polystomum]
MASHDASTSAGSLAAAAAAAAEAAVPNQQQQRTPSVQQQHMERRATSVPLQERPTYRIPIRRQVATASADPVDPADRPIDPQALARRRGGRGGQGRVRKSGRGAEAPTWRLDRADLPPPPPPATPYPCPLVLDHRQPAPGSTWSYARYQQDAGPVPAALAASPRTTVPMATPVPRHAASERSAESIDFHDLARDEDGDQSMLNSDDEVRWLPTDVVMTDTSTASRPRSGQVKHPAPRAAGAHRQAPRAVSAHVAVPQRATDRSAAPQQSADRHAVGGTARLQRDNSTLRRTPGQRAAAVDLATIRGLDPLLAALPRTISSKDIASVRDVEGNKVGRNRAEKIQHQYNIAVQGVRQIATFLHASNAAGVGDAALQIFAQQLAPQPKSRGRKAAAPPVLPVPASVKGKEPAVSRSPRKKKRAARAAKSAPVASPSVATAVHMVAVPDIVLAAPSIPELPQKDPSPTSASAFLNSLPEKLRLEVIAAAQGLAPAAPALPQFPPAITDIDALFLGTLLKETPAIDATKLAAVPLEATTAPTVGAVSTDASVDPTGAMDSATADTPDSAAVATEFVIDLDVSDNEAASVTHGSTPNGAQSPAADGLFNAIDNLGATR